MRGEALTHARETTAAAAGRRPKEREGGREGEEEAVCAAHANLPAI